MTRDELILVALSYGEASTADVAELAGVLERTCRKGLRRLVRQNYVWSPIRGKWRLTRRGREIADELAAAPEGRRR